MRRQLLLACGVLSSLLYVAMLVFVANESPAYSSASQTVSELSAVGAPTRTLWVVLALIYTALVTSFGWGLWRAAGDSRALRRSGGLIVLYGLVGLVWPLAPMHLRETLAAGGATFSDTMHIALAIVTVAIMLAAMGFGAAAFGTSFRVYSIASVIVLALFGVLTSREAPGVSVNQPTPWIGVWERVNIGVFLLWIAVLAVRASDANPRRVSQRTGASARATARPMLRP